MSTSTVTIPNVQVELTVDQLISAVRQLEPGERARLAKALAETELDAQLMQLIAELYSQSSADLSNVDLQAEIDAVRQQRI